MRGLTYEGEVLTVETRSYEAGVTDNGRSFPAGESTTVSLFDGAAITKCKVSKHAEAGLLEALRAAAGTHQSVALRVEVAFGKVQILGDALASV